MTSDVIEHQKGRAMAQSNVVLPIIHLNGDRKETLIRALETAYDALSKARDALRQCAPNGRNFYPIPGRLHDAKAQHRARHDAVQTVMDSLLAEVAGIEAAYPTRGR